MNGDKPDKHTTKASPGASALPISSGDFPTVTPHPQLLNTAALPTLDLHPPTKHAEVIPFQRMIGKYGIIEEIGRGGMGVVYRAHQEDLNRIVALKVVAAGPDADPTESARFRAEAETAANLHHPNIVPVYEVGTKDNLAFLAMEYINGGSLYKLINRKPMDPIIVAKLLEPVARGIHYAHQQEIIHRDLKPSNILILKPLVPASPPTVNTTKATENTEVKLVESTVVDDFIPKITDFGLAKRLKQPLALTQTGMAVGTPHYMAPEQALGKTNEITPATDVYALGAILYEMLTGFPPFGAGSSLETMQQVVNKKPVAPSSIRTNIPRELERICLKCLEKKPANRFKSAAAVADALHGFLNNSQPATVLASAASSAESVAISKRQWQKVGIVSLLLLVFGLFCMWLGNFISDAMYRPKMRHVELELQGANQAITKMEMQYALLMADRGDFDHLSTVNVNDLSPSHADIVAQYRRFELNELPWPDAPKAQRALFDHSGKHLMLLAGERLRTVQHDQGIHEKPQVLPGAGRVLARCRTKPFFAIATQNNQLIFGDSSGRSPTLGQAVPQAIQVKLIQPLEDSSTVFFSDGIDRWAIDRKENKAVFQPLTAPEKKYTAVLAISEQGRWLVEADGVWHVLPIGNETIPPIPIPGMTTQLTFSPSGTQLLAVMVDGALKVFDFNDHRWIDFPADGIATAAAFSNDGNILAVGTRAGTVRLWDVHSRERLSGTANLNKQIISIDISPDRRTIVAITDDEVPHRFRFNGIVHYSPGMRLENRPAKTVVDIAFMTNGDGLYVTTPFTISLWSITSGVRQRLAGENEYAVTDQLLVSHRPKPRKAELKSIAVRPATGDDQHEQVVVGGVDGKLALLSIKADGVKSHAQTEVPDGENVTSISISPDGIKTLAVCDTLKENEAIVRFWKANFGVDITGGKQTTRFPFRITSKCFTADGQHVVFGSEDGIARLWNPESSATTFEREFDCQSRIVCVAVDPTGKLLLTGCADGSAVVFNLADGEIVRRLKHRTEVREVAFQGNRPITAAADGAIRVWHPELDMTIMPPIRHAGSITAMAVRGDLLATACRDRVIRVWKLPSAK